MTSFIYYDKFFIAEIYNSFNARSKETFPEFLISSAKAFHQLVNKSPF